MSEADGSVDADEAFRSKVLWHLRVLSTVAVLFALASVAAGIWAAAELGSEREAGAVSTDQPAEDDPSPYEECERDPETADSADCNHLLGEDDL